MNFFENQQQAKAQTKKLVALFAFAVIAIVLLVNIAVYFSACASNIHCTNFTSYWQQPISWMITFMIIMIISVTSLFRWWQMKSGGGYKAVTMVGATAVKFSTTDPLERRLINVVEEMSIASGVPMPALYVMHQEKGINAFVAGTKPENTCLAVTKGCLEQLTRQELQGVIAHEYSHVFNGDMKINIHLIGILAGILVLGQLGEFLARSSSHSTSSRRSEGGQIAIVGIALMIVGYVGLFFGRWIKAAISRQREYLADASAVQYTRDNQGIANALFKIQSSYEGSTLSSKKAEEVSHMCFEKSSRIKLFSNLLATHPKIDDRIKRVAPNFTPTLAKPKTSDESSNKESTSTDSISREEVFTSAMTTATAASLSPQSLVQKIGTLDSEQVSKAKSLLESIPDSLKDIAHGQNEQLSASDLLLSVLVFVNTQPRVTCLESVSDLISSEQMDNITQIVPLLKGLNNQQVLALTDISVPALAQQASELNEAFIRVAKQLISCDKSVSLMEYIVFAICLRTTNLNHTIEKTFSSFKPVVKDIHYILSLLLQESKTSEERRAKLLAELMKSFGDTSETGASDNHQSVNFNANQFHQSIRNLDRLSPILKAPFIEAMVNCIQDDHHITDQEWVLLRGISNLIDCPAPQI
ncbi:M48 family metallopeptidase [Pleionea litopenaei]|uniref:M48 family metallopeptidase n=1 Tax=Pleionea litopenaei TaxID=3070815 RepID=A0AA51RQ36_9GAMM|nr:M48 family metallopeptidase [Pleionea sp. HL-JVS1]WMS85542.1 M48 family metallopeptidase [Pleionea sp. HL-JVS1]